MAYRNKLKSGRRWHGVIETIQTIVYAVLIALVVRTVAFEPFSIPSGSMLPTLKVGDYLFVAKYSYGYSRYSLPFGLPLIPGRVFFSEPERGDVAVFKLPSDNETDYIKRIIGLPGDRVRVTGGVLHINGAPVRRQRINDYVRRYPYGRVVRMAQYVETLPNGRRHHIIEESDNARWDNTHEYTVPPGHYFAMGDNRDNSQDSRVLSGVGFVPALNLVGRAEWLFFSLDPERPFWDPRAIRFDRLFGGID
ncbi:MAG: signal peptidase I [Kiloniellales bacterium]